MTQHIQNGEFNLFTDIARVQTRCPHDEITDDMILMQARRNRLPAGEPIIVQCMSHDGYELLAQCEYVVTTRRPFLRTVDTGIDQSRTTEEFVYGVVQIKNWDWFGQPEKAPAPRPLVLAETYVDSDAYRQWDPVARTHKVLRRIDNSWVCEHKDKETAERIAAGELPVPVAA